LSRLDRSDGPGATRDREPPSASGGALKRRSFPPRGSPGGPPCLTAGGKSCRPLARGSSSGGRGPCGLTTRGGCPGGGGNCLKPGAACGGTWPGGDPKEGRSLEAGGGVLKLGSGPRGGSIWRGRAKSRSGLSNPGGGPDRPWLDGGGGGAPRWIGAGAPPGGGCPLGGSTCRCGSCRPPRCCLCRASSSGESWACTVRGATIRQAPSSAEPRATFDLVRLWAPKRCGTFISPRQRAQARRTGAFDTDL